MKKILLLACLIPVFTLTANATVAQVDPYIKGKLTKSEKYTVDSDKLSKLSNFSDFDFTKTLKRYCDDSRESYFGDVIPVILALRNQAEAKLEFKLSAELTEMLGKAVEIYSIEGKNFDLLKNGAENSPEFLENQKLLVEFKNKDVFRLTEILGRLQQGEPVVAVEKQSLMETEKSIYTPAPSYNNDSLKEANADERSPVPSFASEPGKSEENPNLEKNNNFEPVKSLSLENREESVSPSAVAPKTEEREKTDELLPSNPKPEFSSDIPSFGFTDKLTAKSDVKEELEKRDEFKPASAFSLEKREDPVSPVAAPKVEDRAIDLEKKNAEEAKVDVSEEPVAHPENPKEEKKKGFFWE